MPFLFIYLFIIIIIIIIIIITITERHESQVVLHVTCVLNPIILPELWS